MITMIRVMKATMTLRVMVMILLRVMVMMLRDMKTILVAAVCILYKLKIGYLTIKLFNKIRTVERLNELSEQDF